MFTLRRLLTIVSSFAVLATLTPALTLASPAAIAPAAAQPGFPVTLSGNPRIDTQSPVIADIVPSNPGLETAIASKEGMLYVVGSSGQVLWETFIPPGDKCGSIPRAFGSPSVGMLDGNGIPYIVIGYGSQKTADASCPGGVVAFDGRNGSEHWRVSLNQSSPNVSLHAVYSTPALADVDGDGTMEVAFGGFDGYFYLLDHSGNLIWRFQTADTIWSSPSFADVDGDGRLDVIFGSDISANSRLGTIDGGFVYAFRTTPLNTTNKTIPFNATPANITNLIWRTQNYDQTIFSSPAVADLNGDGRKEVVFSSGCFFSPATRGAWLKVLDGASGNELLTLALPSCTSSSPAIGDVNGDGKLDIVLNLCGNTFAWSGDGTPLWAVGSFVSESSCVFTPSAVIADVDGNGSLEVVKSGLSNGAPVLSILDGATGAQLDNGSLGLTIDTPAVGDLDGNGTQEIVFARDAALSVLTGLNGVISSPANPNQSPNTAPWAMFHGNPQHTGTQASVPTLLLASGSVSALVSSSSAGQTIGLGIRSNAGALTWSAAADQPWIKLNKQRGTTPDTLVITLDPAEVNNRPGVYDGSITITSSSSAIEIGSSAGIAEASKVIPVRLIVSDSVTQALLPIVLR